MDDNILFTALCKEPEGTFIRNVYPFTFTIPNLQLLWSKVSQFPTLMGKEIHNLEEMVNFFVFEKENRDPEGKGLCVVVDNFIGIFWLTDIEWPRQASIHYTFFDRRHKGRIELCKKAILYVFERYKFHRLYTTVPLYASPALNFIEKIGFIKDGRLRSNTFFKNDWHDSNIYSILESEIGKLKEESSWEVATQQIIDLKLTEV